ncbi:MAG: hypothetical protein LBU43_00105 [Candidatus Accumulibacter sp.]|jgi:predicted nucleic acid-binding protein|nr:hypothetical protein [Accumulibacter sp.]
MMRIALDTNILAYAGGLGDEARCRSAVALVENLAGADVVLPAQICWLATICQCWMRSSSRSRRGIAAASCFPGISRQVFQRKRE